MKMKTILFSLLTLLLIFAHAGIKAQADASAILRKMDDVMLAVKDKTVAVKMVMLNLKSQKEKVKEATLTQKGSAMKLFRYTAPESDAGIATLTLKELSYEQAFNVEGGIIAWNRAGFPLAK